MGRLKREIWKIHPIYTDYEVSDWGRVKRVTPWKCGKGGTREGKILKPYINHNGYFILVLRKNGEEKNNCKIHRLVLETFVGPCPEGCCGHHKNEIKTSNFLSNLEWVYNGEHITKHKTGKILSKESKQKMSITLKGRIITEEWKRKISKSCKGRIFSEEHKQKLSDSAKRRWKEEK
jgi:hypothetical protein